MTSKSMKPSRPARPTPLTQEQIDEQTLRAFMQKREAVALSVLAGIVHNPSITKIAKNSDDLANFAIDTADAVLKKLYTGKPASTDE